ncbi:MAG TPA: hypothetical protein VJN41_09015 [Alphaproteobacteria bacterium]|nr:hypothetical protein [Alphaproteobacteria bacterium]
MPAESPEQHKPLSASEVRRLVGDIPDSQVQAILATGATLEELEEAVAWASGESDVLGELEHPLTGTIAQLYDILTIDEAFEGEREA